MIVSDTNHQPQLDVLEEATRALCHAHVPDGPPPALRQQTLHAIASLTPTSNTPKTRPLQRLVLRYGSLATAAALVVGVILVFFASSSRSAAREFQRAMANAEKASSLSLTLHYPAISNPPIPLVAKAYVRDALTRVDTLNPGLAIGPPIQEVPILSTTIRDDRTRKELVIDHRIKAAETRDVLDPFSSGLVRIIEHFRQLKDKPAAFEREETVDGAPTKVFKVVDGAFHNGQMANVRVWINPTTEMPIRIQIGYDVTPSGMTFEDFDWAPHFRDGLFTMTIPDGYESRPIIGPRLSR